MLSSENYRRMSSAHLPPYTSRMTLSLEHHLPHWLAEHFDLPGEPEVSILRAYTNDVYLVTTCGGRCVLKVYGAGWRLDSEIRFEIDLLDHIASRGVLVARPIDGANGEVLQFVTGNGRQRQAVLFEYAAGEKPAPPFSPGMYEREGKAVAALHRAGDDFATPYERRTLNLTTLIDEPLALVQSLGIDDSTMQAIVEFSRRVRARLEAFIAAGLDWGICHGDLTFDNLHVTGDGDFVWYDFDSGGFGWRAIDVQGWAYGRPERHDRWQAFLRGYREIRPLGDNDIAAAPFLCAAQEIWGIQTDLERRVLAQGDEFVHSYMADAAKQLQAMKHRL